MFADCCPSSLEFYSKPWVYLCLTKPRCSQKLTTQNRFPAYLWHEFSAVPAWGRNLVLWGYFWSYFFLSLAYTFSYSSVILMSHLKGIQLMIIFLGTIDCMAAESAPLWQRMSGGDWRVCRRCFIIFRLILAAVWIKFLLWVLACLWENSSNSLVVRKKMVTRLCK